VEEEELLVRACVWPGLLLGSVLLIRFQLQLGPCLQERAH